MVMSTMLSLKLLADMPLIENPYSISACAGESVELYA